MSGAVAVARPSQALRQRRESQRPSLARNVAKATSMENGTANKEEPRRYVTSQQDILRKFPSSTTKPSLRVYLHPNHFRLNDATDNWSYSGPMKELLVHLKEKTVPHNMLEDFYQAGVPFYDNCLIVEVHNFRSVGVKPQDSPDQAADGNKSVPFSIHNYNNFITPSPFVPFPTKPSPKQDGQNKPTPTERAKEEKETDKENMPAPGQSASRKQPTKSTITTIVLFPTEQSRQADMQLLAMTPYADLQTYRRNQAAGKNAPPTPLTAVPPTPTLPDGRGAKRQKMVIDETNAHEFEAALLNATCPKLYLEPTSSLMESVALIEALTPEQNKNPPPARKTRKRTTAELAADEAEAADTQRFMVAGDDLQASKMATTTGADENQSGMRGGANFQNFARFKTLENIKMVHEENERRKKEDEARQAQAKRQAQAEAEVQKRRAEQEARQAEQNQTLLQQRQQQHQQEMLRQQQQQQQQARALEAQAASQAQQMANIQATQVAQTPQSATQPQFSSPVIRQQTPMTASPHVGSMPMGGAPMVATSSNHGAGSPARPSSVVSHHPAGMARTISQQQNQPMSRTGTPHIVQGTPVMNAAGPARAMNSTPQPRLNQGSPSVPMQGGTPIMMQTPQPNQHMTQEQMQRLQQQRLLMQQRLQQQTPQQNLSPGQGQNAQHMQAAMLKARHTIQQSGVPQGQNPQGYLQALAQRYYQQSMLQAQAGQAHQTEQHNQPNPMASMSPQNPGMVQGTNMNNMNLNQLKQTFAQRKNALLQQFGAIQNIPPEHLQQMRQLETHIQGQERLQRAQMAGQGQGMQGGMNNMGNMPMGAAQNPQNAAQMQRYQQMLQARQQQQQQQLQQQQMLAMRQQQNMGGHMQQNMMNNMQGMNMGGMNMGNMNMQGMNMGNVGQMNMGSMNPQQMNQMQQQMLMQQARAQAQMRAGQRPGPQQGDGLDWSGV